VLLAKSQTGDVILWSLLLVGGIALLGVGVWWLRRWVFSTPVTDEADDWSLQHLREMHARGEISDEEFGRLRGQMISQYNNAASRRAETARPNSALENRASADSRGLDGDYS